MKVYKVAPVVEGLVGWLEERASDLERVLDVANIAEQHAREALANLMKVDRELQALGVPVEEG